MIYSSQIKPDAPVVCSKNQQIATVDHMVGFDMIKLKKDKEGNHHLIPLNWVAKVDAKVHLKMDGDQVMKEWTTPKEGSSKMSSWGDAGRESVN